MPTVFETNGYRFFFYINENNEPVQIHVNKGEAECKFWLLPQIEEDYSYGFKIRERKQIQILIKEHADIIIKNGMNFSKGTNLVRSSDVVSSDPIEKLIFEKGLRIKKLITDKALNSIIAFLNNGKAIHIAVSHFEKLANASQAD